MAPSDFQNLFLEPWLGHSAASVGTTPFLQHAARGRGLGATRPRGLSGPLLGPLAASFGDLWRPLLGPLLSSLFSLVSSLFSLLSSLFPLLSSLFSLLSSLFPLLSSLCSLPSFLLGTEPFRHHPAPLGTEPLHHSTFSSWSCLSSNPRVESSILRGQCSESSPLKNRGPQKQT